MSFAGFACGLMLQYPALPEAAMILQAGRLRDTASPAFHSGPRAWHRLSLPSTVARAKSQTTGTSCAAAILRPIPVRRGPATGVAPALGRGGTGAPAVRRPGAAQQGGEPNTDSDLYTNGASTGRDDMEPKHSRYWEPIARSAKNGG